MVACRSTREAASAGPLAPEPIDGQVCAVCGMLVREQPAPRGQVVHRDGTRAYLCSIGDLRAYLEDRSPHGAAVQVWVEVLPEDFDPGFPPTAGLPWSAADAASFVVGVERPLVMGRTVLAFADDGAAHAVAARLSGHAV
ncbi:MAG: nitrous oxide reductase accessory protein NosL, partial [Myxococcales bacterium]|nr:nitrous oxide reductase accessory protein NosL [Myxococcales bacterium]